MKVVAHWVTALLSLALFSCASLTPAHAQHATDSYAPNVKAPEWACITWSGASIGSGSLIPCGTGSGGGGGSNAAAATVGATAGTSASQTGYVGSDGKVYNWVGDLIGHPSVSIYGTVTATVSGVATATNQTAVQAAPGSSATTAVGVQGVTNGLPLRTTAAADQRTFNMSSGSTTLAASACATPVQVDISAQYTWAYQFSGTTTLTLKFRGPDGATYQTSSYSATATGSTFVPVTAGTTGAFVEVCNTGSNSATALYTTLAN